MFSIEKVFGDLYDKGLGIFDKLIDFEVRDREFDLARDIQLFQSAQAFEADQRRREFFDPGTNPFSGNMGSVLLIGAVAVGAVLLLRR